ncbi:cation-translocating P-type ATPase [Hyphococcus aureus]|uniref:Cation-translocating P-type ATPase n=1 Tax=Hyphococcus aureus TaxID=2666033 RepID=A0ABW1L0D6_9PROT
MNVHDAFAELNAKSEGLSEAEASRRLEADGPNKLPETGRPSRLLIIIRQFNNPLTFILFAAAAAAFILGENADGVFICAVVAINVFIGALQEWRAEASAASLKKTLRIKPTVIRDGVRRVIDIEEIVSGDIVCLESGAVAPADLRLVSAQDLRMDESLLTGESKPASKQSDTTLEEATTLGDRRNMALAGTMVVAGRGVGLVCAVGEATEIGAIAKMLGARGARPPLLIRMEAFSARIGLFIVGLTALLGLAFFLQGAAFSDVLLLSVALAVSAIPEGLPAAITVTLAIASSRMGKRNVIVRRLPAVEALGSCTLIATDKTGTLTVNRLTAKKIILPDGAEFDITGEGLELSGELQPAGGVECDDLTKDRVFLLSRAAALTNEAAIHETDGVVEAQGDSVDIAFLVLAEKLGARKKDLQSTFRRHSALPYEPQHGYSASLDIETENGFISAKGAPEIVLNMCAHFDRKTAEDALHRLASAGYRVIAVAQGSAPSDGGALEAQHLGDLDFLGFVGLIDPLRREAPEAVACARAAGIDVRMVTGDHPETALAIARQLDPSWAPETVLTGAELSSLTGDALRDRINGAAIFARVEPAQKNLIVRELQAQGHFVAVTGDGVNDAPALKAANVGVAMGAGGTDVARAAADLIITDDNFASIVAGVEEGRAAYDNIRKIVWLLLATAVTEVLIFILALTFSMPIPLTAVQILWMNLVTEGVQDVALAFEGKEPDLMKRKPRRPKEPIFDRQMIEQCLVIGLYVSIISFGLYYYLYEILGFDIETARNITLLFLVSFHNFHAFNCRSETRSAFRVPLRANPILIFGVAGAQLLHILAMYTPVISDVLEIEPVALWEWAVVFALGGTVVVVGELYKFFIARPRAQRHFAGPMKAPAHA